MKFLLVTYNDSDGVGQTVVNLNNNLNNLGHQSKIILLSKSTEAKNTIKIERDHIKRIIYFPFEFLKKRFSDLFSFDNSTVDIKKVEEQINNSDIIIIFTLHKFLTLNMISKLFQKKNIIYFRPLDMELATGGCHVNFIYENAKECDKYLTGCNKCPKLNNFNFFNISNKIFERKKMFFDRFKPTILLENKFTKNFYDRSPVTKNAKNEVVFLPVRESRKNSIKKSDARKLFNFKMNEKILLFGTYNLDAPHKGGRILDEILNIFVMYSNSKDTNLLKNNNVRIVTFGRKQGFKIKTKQIHWSHLNEIKGDMNLNSLYRCADIFVSPSTGCNAPSTIREATSNDIPVVAFNNGEASEAIKNNVNGILIANYDKEKFATAIFDILFKKNFYEDKRWQELLRSRYNSKLEAEMIIRKAQKDFNC